jgi:sugar lactone lactonase YvrE
MKTSTRLFILINIVCLALISIAKAEVSTFAKGFNSPTGLAFYPSDNILYVKSGTTGKLWAISINSDGTAGEIQVRASDFLPSMQIVFDAMGNLYGLGSEYIYRLNVLGKIDKIKIGGSPLSTGITVEIPGLSSNKVFFSHKQKAYIDWIYIDQFSARVKTQSHSQTSCGVFRFLNYRHNVGDIVGTSEKYLVKIVDGACTILLKGFVQPNGIAEDELGNLYVADTGTGTITQLTPVGKSLVIATGLSSPTGLAYYPKSRLLFVSETGKGQISAINLDKIICIQSITYAKNPVTLNWVIFPTPCDVPTGWLISSNKPKGFKQPVEKCKGCRGGTSTDVKPSVEFLRTLVK